VIHLDWRNAEHTFFRTMRQIVPNLSWSDSLTYCVFTPICVRQPLCASAYYHIQPNSLLHSITSSRTPCARYSGNILRFTCAGMSWLNWSRSYRLSR